MQGTLETLLDTFSETGIADIKKRLIGQYVIMIKKGAELFFFNYFMGVRNLFYTEDEAVPARAIAAAARCQVAAQPDTQTSDV